MYEPIPGQAPLRRAASSRSAPLSGRALPAVLCGALSLGVAGAGAAHAADASPSSLTAARRDAARAVAFGAMPLSFEENRGQAESSVRYLAHGLGYGVALDARGATLTVAQAPGPGGRPARAATVRMALVGGDARARVAGQGWLPGTVSYLSGPRARRGLAGIRTYAAVRDAGVYPGIDVVYHGTGRQLEYDAVVAPGARPGAIRLRFAGARPLALAPDGSLLLRTAAGAIREHAPTAYQDGPGGRRPVAARYALLDGRTVGFRLGRYDARRALVIDPSIVYSTYQGGPGNDAGNGIAVDAQGDAYVTGKIATATGDTPQLFVTKYAPGGASILYTAYLPGSDYCGTVGNGIAIDARGDAYVVGNDGSSSSVGCNWHVLVAKLDPSGTQIRYQEDFGETGYDSGNAIAVDAGGNAYVTGAMSRGLPVTPGVFQSTAPQPPNTDVFALKLDPSGGVSYATYVGDGNSNAGNGIKVDANGDAYLAGVTGTRAFPVTPNGFQTTPPSGLVGPAGATGFLAELNPTGAALLYATYLGGNWADTVNDLALDDAGHAYVVGKTSSSNFPTTSNAYQRGCGSDGTCDSGQVCYTDHCVATPQDDAFVAELDTARSGPASLLYSTYLGGEWIDRGQGIAVDTTHHVYVTGYTGSKHFPIVNMGSEVFGANDWEAFVAAFDPSQAGPASLLYSTYLGRDGDQYGYAVATDAAGHTYVTGETTSTNFPTVNPIQGSNAGVEDAFVTEIDNSVPLPSTSTPVPSTNTPAPPTNTPVPPTATSTPPPPATATTTSTRVPPAATATNTPLPPAATNTPLPPAATNTPPPPATRTPVPPVGTAPTVTPMPARTAAPTVAAPAPTTGTPIPPARPGAPASATPPPTTADDGNRGGQPGPTPRPATGGPRPGPRPAALPLGLGRMPAAVRAGSTLTLAIKTAARARVGASLRIAATRTVVVGRGAHRERIARTVVLYAVSGRGQADRSGRVTLRLRVAPRLRASMRATLNVRAVSGRTTATRSIALTVQVR